MPESIAFNEDYVDVMKRFPDHRFDWAICDIPYGIGVGKMAYLTEKNTTVKQKNGNRINGNRNKKAYTLKEWDISPPPQEYFNELRRICKNQIIFGIEYVNWEGVGSGRIKWDKGVADGVSFKRYETAYCSSIDGEVVLPLLWAGMQQAKSLSEPMTQQGNKKLNEKRIYPTHKPILLYQKLLSLFVERGMSVFDSHLGGGSNRIACHGYGCDFIAAEIDKEYYDKQQKRFNQYISQYQLNFK